jgi:hypothetical protein
MQQGYKQFANNLLDRLEIFAGDHDPVTVQKKYYRLREKSVANTWGAGISFGYNMPHGWGSAELTRHLGYRWDVNAGIGIGPSGFKIGAGLRLYLLNYGKKYKPFLAAQYAWASGMRINMGGQEDESGNQLYPEEVSTFKIPSDQAVHLRAGFRWLSTNHSVLLSAGYAIPFMGYEARFISGRQSERRQNIANAFTVGGFEGGLTYIYYFKRVE